MASQPTAFAQAIEEFIQEKQRLEDKNSLFYRELLSKVHAGALRRDDESTAKKCAQDLAAFVIHLQEENRTQSKGRRFSERLGRISSGLNQYAGACDVLIQAGPSAAVLLYGGARIMLQLAQKVHDCYETVVAILEDINDYVRCFCDFSRAYQTSEEVQRQLLRSYKAIISFWLKASQLLSGHSLAKIFSRNSQLSREWQKHRVDLQNCSSRVSRAAQAAEADLRRTNEVQTEVQAKEKNRKDLIDNVAKWIKAGEDESKYDFRDIIRTNAAVRHESTGDWLLADPDFQAWRNANRSTTLWLCAPPGTGKSILASYVAQTLEDANLKTACFFFSYNDPAQNKPINALRAIALHLLAMHRSVPDSVQRVYESDTSKLFYKLEQLQSANEVVQGLAKQIDRVHIVIDGLDECADRKELLDVLPGLLKMKTHGIVKWLFTSRPEPEFQSCMDKYKVSKVIASKDKLLSDVRTFVKAWLVRTSREFCDTCLNELVSRSDGNFLWAHLTIRIFDGVGFTCEEEVEEALESFPRGLEGCYERTLRHLVQTRTPAEIQLAKRVFTIMVAAMQPLRLSEVSHAISALPSSGRNPTTSDFNPKRLPSMDKIATLCSGLITFESVDDMEDGDAILRFSHKSVRDFFVEATTTMEIPEDIQDFFVSEQSACSLLGEACLRYLSFSRYMQPCDVKVALEDKDNALLAHASAYWHKYLSNSKPTQALYDQVLDFARSPCFWNCFAVQVRVVPHLFARFYEIVPGKYIIQVGNEQDSEDMSKVSYGSPLPTWLEDEQYGTKGRQIIQDVQAFVSQWYQVLNSHPDGLSVCAMDHEWEITNPGRRLYGSDRANTWSLRDQETSGHFIDISPDRLGTKWMLYTMRSSGDFACVEWELGEAPAVIKKRQLPAISTGYRNPSQRPLTLLSKTGVDPVVLYQDELTISKLSNTVINLQPPKSVVSHSEALQGSWHVLGHSDGSHMSATYCSSEVPVVKGDREHLLESLTWAEDNPDSDAESASGQTDDSGIGLDPAHETGEEPNRCMVLNHRRRSPIWHFWHSNDLVDARCAVHPQEPLCVWSASESEALVANLGSGDIKTIYLPEPVLTQSSPPSVVRKEFHFSEDAILYYLLYTANADWHGVQQKLTISQLSFSNHESEPRLNRVGSPCTLEYSSAGILRWPFILTTWSADHVYVAMPSLSSDTKLVRLKLHDLESIDSPQFSTLRDPIFFPSSTPDRNPNLYIFYPKAGEEDLTLTLGDRNFSKPPSDTSSVQNEPPAIFKWRLKQDTDWRSWSVDTDAESESYKSASDTYKRLRGTFVSANDRLDVPVRSGLDWTKKAWVSGQLNCWCTRYGQKRR